MSYAFERLNPYMWDKNRLGYDGPIAPVLDRVLDAPVNHTYAAIDCTRVLLGMMEHKRLNPDSPAAPEGLRQATASVKSYLTSGDVGRLAGLQQAARAVPDLEKVEIDEGGHHFLHYALTAESCVYGSENMKRRVGEKDSLIIALGSSGVLPGIQVAICRDSSVGGETEVYPVRFSARRRQDDHPVVAADELEYLRQASDGRGVVIYDETIGWGKTMQKALEFFGEELDRPDIEPVWSDDVQGLGAKNWPVSKEMYLQYAGV